MMAIPFYFAVHLTYNHPHQYSTTTPLHTTLLARLINKILSDFCNASLKGVKSILDGYVLPMNPDEQPRSHVYLHNNIFFSRAIDAGDWTTFKIIQGDAAAKKSASRDAHNLGVLHRLDIPGLHTLATVLIEYLGVRFICQSIVPGILHGEKSHSLLYGAIETLSALKCDDEMHKLLESSLGEGCMVASRRIPAHPLTDERMDIIKKCRVVDSITGVDAGNDDTNSNDEDKTIQVCGPMEMKGIEGSDKRKYVLDCTRLTPRDANWVSEAIGGTGRWEDLRANNAASSSRKNKTIPSDLDDDEWTACVLRPELVTGYAEMKLAKYAKHLAEQSEEATKATGAISSSATGDAAAPSDSSNNDKPSNGEKEEDKAARDLKRKELMKKEEEYIRSLRYNVNVFLPFTRSIETIDEASQQQLKEDEEEARNLARHLWDTVIPTLMRDVRSSSGSDGGASSGIQVPVDGKSLTELIHQRGINCRYLGRLAELARREELEDIIAFEKASSIAAAKTKDDTAKTTKERKMSPRFRMPLCWLEQLECEMVARAAKHVLDSYLMEAQQQIGGGNAQQQQPVAQIIASFLSAVVSTGEESAAETEKRTSKSKQSVLDQDVNALTLFDVSGGDDAPSLSRGRAEIWLDIEREIGRRYRYTLSLFNNNPSKKENGEAGSGSRALHMPLLRRICQRSGIRLVAKQYDVGNKCVCGGDNGGGLLATYPVAPTDILDILPLVKHASSVLGESFIPCSFSGSIGAPSLHVLFQDAKTLFELGHANLRSGNSAVALEYAQESAHLYQRVLDTPVHPQIAKCLKLQAIAHYHRDETDLALAAATKYLAVSISLLGFDSSEVLHAHLTMVDILVSTGKTFPQGMKHLRAAQFLMEFMAGKNYSVLPSTYFRMGSHYVEAGNREDGLRFYQAASQRRSEDRMFDCLIARSIAGVLAGAGHFKLAVDYEKRAYQLYVTFVGEEHDATKASYNSLIVSTQYVGYDDTIRDGLFDLLSIIYLLHIILFFRCYYSNPICLISISWDLPWSRRSNRRIRKRKGRRKMPRTRSRMPSKLMKIKQRKTLPPRR